MAASSLVTTVDDYTAFLGHVCAGGTLVPELYDEMIRSQSPTPADYLGLEDGQGPVVSWGLGWMILDLGGQVMIGHGGNNDEYTAFAGFMRGSGEGIVMLTNGTNGQELIQTLLMPDVGG